MFRILAALLLLTLPAYAQSQVHQAVLSSQVACNTTDATTNTVSFLNNTGQLIKVMSFQALPNPDGIGYWRKAQLAMAAVYAPGGNYNNRNDFPLVFNPTDLGETFVKYFTPNYYALAPGDAIFLYASCYINGNDPWGGVPFTLAPQIIINYTF